MHPRNRGVDSRIRVTLGKVFLPLVLAILFGSIAWAQSTSGSIVGAVRDGSGGVIPGAKVTLTNTGTSASRSVETDENGSYQFVNLAPGQYQLAIEKGGFKRKVLAGVQVLVQQTVRADAALDVGAVTETVEVSTQAALLQTEQSSLSQAVEGRTVQEMPLNGRNVMNLVGLAPGVVPQGRSDGSPVGGSNGSSTNVNGWGNYQIGGGAANQSASYYDGAPLNVSYTNSTILVPTQGAVQEFRVATNSVSPEFGRFAGGVVNLASKSGTNSFHGEAYEYTRNQRLNASNYFATTKPNFNQNQYGAALSGPIVRDKTFFMFTWDKFKVRVQNPLVYSVPTAAMKAGDFTGTGIPTIYDPLTVCGKYGNPACALDASGNPIYVRQPFAGNIIPSSRFDQTAVAMLNLYAPPTTTGISNNFKLNATAGGDTYQFNTRVDHAINDKQHLFARYTYWNGNVLGTQPFGNKVTTGQPQKFATTNAVVGYTWTVNPTTVADVRLSYLRFVFGFYPPSTGTDLSTFGPAWGALQNKVVWAQFPAPQPQSFQGINFVTARNANNNIALSESLTKIIGRHNLKFGAESRKIEWAYAQTNYSSGQFTFNNGFTAQNPLSPSGSGYSIASMLLGYATSPGSQIQEILIAKQQMWYHGLYAQDTFQLNSRLTLNLGVRWEYPGQFKEAHNSAAVFLPDAVDPFGATVGIPALKGLATMVNSSTYSSQAIHPSHLNLFGPRVGFAYKVTNDMVVRGGYGLSYLPNDVVFGDSPWTTPPNLATTPMTTSTDGGITPANVVSNPFPGGILQPSRNISNLEPLVLGAVIQLPVPNQKYPYAQQWNFAIQQQIPGNTALEIGYAGSKGTHLPANAYISGFPYWEMSQLPDQYQSMGSALLTKVANPFFGKVPTTAGILTAPTIAQGQLLRPYPQFSSVNNTSAMYGSTTWHALMVKVEKRLHSGGTILGTYTWSKLIGNADSQTAWLDGGGVGQNAAGIQDYTNLKGERGLTSFDVPQRATISYVLDLPFGRGKHFGTDMSKALDAAVGGWGINGTTTFQSGFPMLFTAQPSTLNSTFGGGITRPNYVAGCAKSPGGSAFDRQKSGKWFNTSCFTQPGAFAFGNQPRADGSVRSAGIANFDVSLNKNFKLTERYNLKFSSEVFNLFNRVQFAAPTGQLGTANFGKITATRNQQRLIQLAARFTF